jgi:uncharacterized tellurite resistance protein B-like protein
VGLVITRPDGTSRAISGYVFREPEADANAYEPDPATEPRPKVDLRPLLTEVENQGKTNSCAANAVAGAYEYLVQRHLPEDETYDVSRMFIYYAGREEEGGPIEDQGSVLRLLIQSLKTKGAPSEETWPFDLDRVNERPSDEAYQEAAEFVVEDALHMPTDLHAWKCALTEGHPIIFGMKLFDSFDAHRKPGLVPAPTAAETSRASHGGHAMLAVGYSDKDKVFIVRNSWGSEWGDAGYCYIPYDYLINPKYNFGDSWIIKQVASLDPEEGWAEDDDQESVLPDLEGEIANMSEEQYAALLEAMGRVPLETRIAHILLAVAGADGDVADEELDALSGHLATVMAQLGSELDPGRVLRFAKKHDEDQELFDESVELLGQHLSAGMLAALIAMAREVADADETSEDEEDLLAHLVESWQVEE